MLSRFSISTRLALWYGLSLLLLLTIFVAGLYASVHVGLHRDLDRQLHEEAEAVLRHLEAHHTLRASSPETSASDAHDHSMTTSARGFVRLIDSSGRVRQSGPSFPAAAFSPDLPTSAQETIRRHTWNGRLAKTLYVPLETSRVPGRWLEVTKLESALHNQLHRLRWLLVLGVLVGSGGAVGIGYVLARQSLRPVAVLTDAAQKMKDRPAGTLPTNFRRDDELSNLAETFNELFRRLRSTIERERRFRADAAHELFTPLTAIQSEIDVTLRSDRASEAYRSALQAVRAHTEELSSILRRLMTLSEVEARDHGPAPTSLNAAERIRTRIERIRPRALEREITIEGPEATSVDVPIEPDHLDLIADHLLDNAIKYSSSGDTVHVSVRPEAGTVRIRVADTGMGFAENEASHLFDRFYRTGAADAAAEGGGLGLAIVQSVVQSYNGSITASSEGRGRGSTFEVTLPVR